ncbi:unnamed protein product [Phytophthora fragariaefolia]|uniref:Unnamed protein product n=1 Tax=Phytophthora fragariaefolia TaxID=1490495 RepID=A0A9W6XLB4_9STRA|nr:unnamed protein product [Phytophthora fragariaefolia]
MSEFSIADVPFVPEHEVQRESTSLSSGSSGTVFRGNWKGSKVVIKYVDVKSPDDMRAFLQEEKYGTWRVIPTLSHTMEPATFRVRASSPRRKP